MSEYWNRVCEEEDEDEHERRQREVNETSLNRWMERNRQMAQDRARSFTAPQSDPEPGTGPSINDLVVVDLETRREMGQRKYGTVLQANNGRDALIDAYQEALDLCQYLRQELYERYGQ